MEPPDVERRPPGLIAAPSIALPKGGGAIRGIGDKFAAATATGTGSFTVPLPFSPGRAGLQPPLTLTYDSGAGNGPFGLGWSLGLPAISRKTDRGLPKYEDQRGSDVFLLSGAEDLVPAIQPDGTPDEDDRDGYHIDRFRPRTEGMFARIERWTRPGDPSDVMWRTITGENVTAWYGRDAASRIVDPADPSRIFSWLLCESYDDLGNGIQYSYKAEDAAGVATNAPHECRRTIADRTGQRYLKSVRYGNVVSRLDPDRGDEWLDDWLFEMVFDYGEGHYVDVPLDQHVIPSAQLRFAQASLASAGVWPARPDPFSTHRSGFEVRSYRRCLRALMFHRMRELGGEPCLVKAVEFDYADLPPGPIDAELRHQGSTGLASFLVSFTQHGFQRVDAAVTNGPNGERYVDYVRQSMPPVTLRYSKPDLEFDVQTLGEDSASNLPVGLGDDYEWVDLDGDGTSGILTERSGAWWYKRNRGGGTFGPLELVPLRPAAHLGGGGRLLDLGGDGLLDLVDFDGPGPGFYERTEDADWASHRAFRTLPNVGWDDPNLRLTDLTGDGSADVLITEADALTWYPSLGEDGFEASLRTSLPLDDDAGPRVVFADGTSSIYLADMSGDGLADLVRICVGEISYWPNLGYGRFGPRIVMDDSPRFDTDNQFDQSRIRLADVDGSGVTDIVYLGRRETHVYFNRSGNGWSGPLRVAGFPAVDNISSVSTVDLLGTGTTCLVWSSSLPGDERSAVRYIDLMASGKPHLLVEIHNNLGAETSISYESSTRFFLEDLARGTPWITRLPFPVHVVTRVDTVDRLSGNRFVSRYEYHHGFYDGEEREFRGFARVDQYDTAHDEDSMAHAGEPSPTNVDAASFVPPVLTRTWFHTGAFVGRERISRLCADEYYGEPGVTPAPGLTLLLADTQLPDDLTVAEEREACRALRGSMLRQEVYAIDGSGSAEHPFGHPYVVTEQNARIRLVQRRGPRPHAVFQSVPAETLSYHYERDPEDPRVTHALTLATDSFGQPTQTANVSYGRRAPDLDLPAELRAEQIRLSITVTDTAYTNDFADAAATPDDHRLPAPWAVSTFEISGLDLVGTNVRFAPDEIIGAVAAAADRAYEADVTVGQVEKRLIESDRTRYRKDDLSGPCGWGTIQPRALKLESYRLCFTPSLLAATFQRTSAAGVQDLLGPIDAILPVTANALGDTAGARGGYVELDGSWWIPSGRSCFHSDPASTPAEELDEARRHFFLSRRYRNPFHTRGTPAESFVTYDPHDLQPEASTDALGNATAAALDYRTLLPALVTGPNGERTAVAFDALGMVVATATMGRTTGTPQGDVIGGIARTLTDTQLLAALADPFADPEELLGTASTRLVYDLFAYARTRGAVQPDPPAVYTLARETHVSDLAVGAVTRVQHSYSYSDGFGREIQKKIRAEGGRWVGSGWTEFDNKGNPARQWEPFFSPTHRCEFDARVGASKALFYDPLGRVIAVLHPNDTYEKTVFDAWRQVTFDASDTVAPHGVQTGDPRTDPDIADVVAGHFRTVPANWRTWLARRQAAGASAADVDAASKASVHADTPTVAHLDALGRTFLTRTHNGFDPAGNPVFFDARVVLDIEGNQRAVFDAEGRRVSTHDFDIAGNGIHQASMEAGERWKLADVMGNPIRSWDSRGHTLTTEYDALRRPVRRLVVGTGASSDPGVRAGAVLYHLTEYGEAQPNAASKFLRGRVFREFDAAGVVTNSYDFKGNVVRQIRAVTDAYSTDWAQPQPAGTQYVSSTRYDALNRQIQQIAPRRNIASARRDVIQPVHNDAGLLEALHVWTGLAADPVGLIDPVVTAPDAVGVDDIDYDAKGLRTSITYRNGVVTTYDYDPDTFRLVRLTTRRGQGNDVLQDLHYTFDPVGNITDVRDTAQRTLFFANQVVSPSNRYTYDATYRLVAAEGREHVGQGGAGHPHSYDDRRHLRLPQPGDGSALSRYGETYEYDRVGNMVTMAHTSGVPGGGWTRTYSYDEPTPFDDAVGGIPRRTNRLSSSTVGGTTETFSSHGDGYDPHGNLLRMPQLAEVGWDFLDRLHVTSRQRIDATDADGTARHGDRTFYVYDASGARVRKVTVASGAVKEERLYLGGVEVYRKRRGQHAGLERRTLHVVDGTQRIALIETRNNVDDGSPLKVARYQVGDHLGSAALEVDEQPAANIISYEEFSPYGSTTYQAVRNVVQVPAKRYRFTGQERDEESGLYYHGARYYAPWLARWISCDPTSADNLYRYVECNPIALRDTDGHDAQCAGQEGCDLSLGDIIRANKQVIDKHGWDGWALDQEAAKELSKIKDDTREANFARASEEKAAGVPPRWDRFKAYVGEKAHAAGEWVSETRAGKAVSETRESLKETARNVGSEGMDNTLGGLNRSQQMKGPMYETPSHLGGEMGEMGYEVLEAEAVGGVIKGGAVLLKGGAAAVKTAAAAPLMTNVNGKQVKSWLQSVLVGVSRRQFRKAAERIIRDTPGHPLAALLQKGRFQNATAQGVTAVEWLADPRFVEAGHVASLKGGQAEQLILMSAHKNRWLASTVEHPSLGGHVQLPTEALDIGGVAIDLDLADDLVAAGHLDATVVANAKHITF